MTKNKPKVGDKVTFIPKNWVGHIVELDGNYVFIELSNGTEVEAKLNQIKLYEETANVVEEDDGCTPEHERRWNLLVKYIPSVEKMVKTRVLSVQVTLRAFGPNAVASYDELNAFQKLNYLLVSGWDFITPSNESFDRRLKELVQIRGE